MDVILTISILLSMLISEANSFIGFYADDGFHRQTVLLEKLPHYKKKVIKEEMLHLLGLPEKPKPRLTGRQTAAPHYMYTLYQTLETEKDVLEDTNSEVLRAVLSPRNLTLPGMEESLGTADMIMSFLTHNPPDELRMRHSSKRQLYFNFREIPPEQSITGAELRLYKQYTAGHKIYHIQLYRLARGDSEHDRLLEVEAELHTSSYYDGWLEFNVTNAAKLWNFYPHSNYGLYLQITDHTGVVVDPSEAGIVGRHDDDAREPFLVAFFQASQQVKVRRPRSADREAESESRRANRNREVSYSDQAANQWGFGGGNVYSATRACQQRTMYVHFKELNWAEWIIAPEGYSAYYCHGECNFPLNVHMNATNHAIVQTLVNLMNPYGVPKASCAPTKLSAISVLYFDDDANVVLKKYRNMVVQACGCH